MIIILITIVVLLIFACVCNAGNAQSKREVVQNDYLHEKPVVFEPVVKTEDSNAEYRAKYNAEQARISCIVNTIIDEITNREECWRSSICPFNSHTSWTFDDGKSRKYSLTCYLLGGERDSEYGPYWTVQLNCINNLFNYEMSDKIHSALVNIGWKAREEAATAEKLRQQAQLDKLFPKCAIKP